jgi:coenzyme F420-reducing hydrogenase delta subunit
VTQVLEAGTRPPDQAADVDLHIVAFCCHYCAYAAADLAGALRMQSPPTVRVVKLPCTGKVDVLLLLQALEHGADGVMVAGCLEGDCHYMRGNLYARQRVERVQELLGQVGLEPERARMFNMSSGMGQAWADAVTEMDAQIRALGPSPLRQPTTHQLDSLIEDTDTTAHEGVDAHACDNSDRVTSSASPGRPGP